jgi:hypothetical protein
MRASNLDYPILCQRQLSSIMNARAGLNHDVMHRAPPASFQLIGSQTQSYDVLRRFLAICEQFSYPELRLTYENYSFR